MNKIDGGLDQVPGYRFSAMECGIRYKDRLDFCIIVTDVPCNAAGLFTTNKIFAAPVRLCRERIGNSIRAILINATNANASTGEQGYNNTLLLTEAVAKELKSEKDSVLMASTGVIGHQLPVDKMLKAVPDLTGSLSRENGSVIPKAIMTTDTYPKSIACEFSTSLGKFRLAGTAKGSGMIAPNMATLLSFLITDCPVDKKTLDLLLKKCINITYNAITIDGDMSTNDTVLLFSPVSERYIQKEDDIKEFENALEYILTELARMLVMDGEGATKFVIINVTGAKDDIEAVMIARSVSESLLVKTAFFGTDPNWGRIACAAGYSGASVNEENLSIYIENIPLLEKGVPVASDAKKLKQAMSEREFSVLIDIGIGNGKAKFYTCDISYDYVKINAEYTT
ncbi:MAG: bifunctional glutamate N-acetyltransferase/amino-acid acetyltransferase ArgJ [Spirochaetes bacterium]|nr:bifunctional glutamate N-acetyltransferase/amino-acid acetyltransferase ArgJ [Spirochaetota bacterium]